jgi:hypothetical protein
MAEPEDDEFIPNPAANKEPAEGSRETAGAEPDRADETARTDRHEAARPARVGPEQP